MKSKYGAYVSKKYSFPVYLIHRGRTSLSANRTMMAVRPQASQDHERVRHWPRRAASRVRFPWASSRVTRRSLLTLTRSLIVDRLTMHII